MARQKKPQAVGTFIHPETKTEVPLFLDRETFQFYGEIDGIKFQDATKDGLEGRLNKAIDEHTGYVWTPVIQLRSSSGGYGINKMHAMRDGLMVSAFRFYYAPRLGGGLVWVDWNIPEAERNLYARDFMHWSTLQQHPFTPPCEFEGYLSGVSDEWYGKYLPYDENLWFGLESLIGRIGQVRDQLAQLLFSEQGRKMLSSVGANLLMLPSPDA